MSFEPSVRGFVLGTQAGHLIELPAWTMVLKVRAADTDGRLTVIRGHMAGHHQGPAAHVHGSHDETFFILEGSLRFQLGGSLRDADPGETAFAPRGLAHGFSNPSDQAAIYLAMLTPSGYEAYFEKVAQHFRDTGDLPDRDLTIELMAQHDTRLHPRY